jgi:hypothetical protein
MSEITTLDNETSAHRLDSAQTETLTPDKYKYEKVCDRQGHPVEGLWERNGVYYIQAYIEGKGTRKLALYNPQKERVKNVAEAKAAMAEFQKSKQSGNLPASGRCPKFKDYYEEKYLKVVSKDPKTLKKERGNLQLWEKTLGELRLNQIRMEHLQAHVKRRLEEDKISPRTVNLDLGSLSNCLRQAVKDNWLQEPIITERYDRLDEGEKEPARLYTIEEVEIILKEAMRKHVGSGLPLVGR